MKIGYQKENYVEGEKSQMMSIVPEELSTVTSFLVIAQVITSQLNKIKIFIKFKCAITQELFFPLIVIALLTRSPSVSERRAPLSFPWEKLTDNIKEKLDLHVPLPDERKLELRKIICMHLTGTLKDYTRTTTNAVVNLLLNKYPEALVIKDADGDILNNGAKAFCIKLYDQVQYKKPASQKISRKRPPSSAENDENEEGNSSNSSSFHTSIRSVRHRDFDEYGTVAYEPPLPDGETKLSQESKLMRLRLLHSKRDKNDDDEIKQLLSETYATQRKDIIDRVGTLNEFLKNWPHLEDAEHFLNHASVLFDRDMKEVWDEKLAAKGAALFSIFEKECEKSNQVCVARREARRKMKEAVIEANEASENLTTQTPKYLSLFKLLPLYFLEEDNKMYHIVSVSTFPAYHTLIWHDIFFTYVSF